MKLAVAAALAGLAQAGSIPYKNCGNSGDILQGVTVNATPDPPVPGANVAVEIDGTLKADVDSGAYHLAVSFDGITIIQKSGSLCDLTTCPVKAGHVKITKTEKIPSSVPKGNYDLKISATANSGTPLFCADATLSLGESESTSEDVMIENQIDLEFDSFIQRYGRTYTKGSEAYVKRRRIFGDNVKYIRQQNARYEAGEITHHLGMNEFTDLSAEEFSVRNGYQRQTARVENDDVPTPEQEASIPQSINWATHSPSVVTPVKNQGQCGSCWSFSTTGSIESRSAIATGQLISLSEQQLMDCSGSYGNQGCSGGEMDDAFQYVIATGGLSTEQCDPYQTQQEQCAWQQDGCSLDDPIKGYHDVTPSCEKCMLAAVAQGPVSVAVDASGSDWQFYQGGVLGADGSCGTSLDHGVLAVGYGSSNGQPFWTVKNSWGAEWGMGGYVQIARGLSPSACGILMDPSFPCVNSAGQGNCTPQ